VTAPTITILLSTYNGEIYLKSQLDSIAAQSHTGWRIAWRDDGSIDNSVAVVEKFA
jgi:glycosyltransferase involved in cell wall biosynthesis